MDLAFVFQICPSQVAVEGHSPVTLGVCSHLLGISQVLHTVSMHDKVWRI